MAKRRKKASAPPPTAGMDEYKPKAHSIDASAETDDPEAAAHFLRGVQAVHKTIPRKSKAGFKLRLTHRFEKKIEA